MYTPDEFARQQQLGESFAATVGPMFAGLDEDRAAPPARSDDGLMSLDDLMQAIRNDNNTTH